MCSYCQGRKSTARTWAYSNRCCQKVESTNIKNRRGWGREGGVGRGGEGEGEGGSGEIRVLEYQNAFCLGINKERDEGKGNGISCNIVFNERFCCLFSHSNRKRCDRGRGKVRKGKGEEEGKGKQFFFFFKFFIQEDILLFI